MPNLALKEKDRNSKTNGGGIIRLACRAPFPPSVTTEESRFRMLMYLESVFPRRIKLENNGSGARIVLMHPRNDCEKFGECIEIIAMALAEGKEPILPIPNLVGTALVQKSNGSQKPKASGSSLSALPTHRHEWNWRKATAQYGE
jgi:hypothetical protein